MTKLVRISKGADVRFQSKGVVTGFSNFRGSWVNPDDIASVVLFDDGRCWMQMRSAKGEVKCYVDDIEKFERDLGLAAESEPNVEQVRSLKEYGAACRAAFEGPQSVLLLLEEKYLEGVRAVLDLAGVKYTD